MSTPETHPAELAEAQQAVVAAQTAFATSATLEARGRLAGRLGQLARAQLEHGEQAAAAATAREAVLLAREALPEGDQGGPGQDRVVGEFGVIARDAAHVLLHTGAVAEARELLREGLRVTTERDGPRARRGRAAILLETSLSVGSQVVAMLQRGDRPPHSTALPSAASPA